MVDHDPDFLRLLAELLRDEGYDAAVPPDIQQPAQFVKQRRPDLLILDVIYHQMADAQTILDELELDPSTTGIPVLACSTTPAMLARLRQRANGLYTLPKPYGLDDLLRTVERILRDHPPRPK